MGILEETHQCLYHYDPREHQCPDLRQANLLGYQVHDQGLYQYHHTNHPRRHPLVDWDTGVLLYWDTGGMGSPLSRGIGRGPCPGP